MEYRPPQISIHEQAILGGLTTKKQMIKRSIYREVKSLAVGFPLCAFFAAEPESLIRIRQGLLEATLLNLKTICNDIIAKHVNALATTIAAHLAPSPKQAVGKAQLLPDPFDRRRWPSFPEIIHVSLHHGTCSTAVGLEFYHMHVSFHLVMYDYGVLDLQAILAMQLKQWQILSVRQDDLDYIRLAKDLLAATKPVLLIIDSGFTDSASLQMLLELLRCKVIPQRPVTMLTFDLSTICRLPFTLQSQMAIANLPSPRLASLVSDLVQRFIIEETQCPFIMSKQVLDWLSVIIINETMSFVQIVRVFRYILLCCSYGNPLRSLPFLEDKIINERTTREYIQSLVKVVEELASCKSIEPGACQVEYIWAARSDILQGIRNNSILASLVKLLIQYTNIEFVDWTRIYHHFYQSDFIQSTFMEDLLRRTRMLPFDQFIALIKEMKKCVDQNLQFATILDQCLESTRKRKGSGSDSEMINAKITITFVDQFIRFLNEFNETRLTFQSFLVEALIFDNVCGLEKAFHSAPTETIYHGLRNPHFYFQCSCCSPKLNQSNQIISASLPDVSILYLLSLECGQLINMYDWYTSFKSIIESTDSKQSLTQDKQRSKLLSRFMFAVAELEMLGIIVPTKRKKDHYERKNVTDYPFGNNAEERIEEEKRIV